MKFEGASTWTDERTALAVKLYGDGLSCSQIAKKIGGITRNAVIGKISRLGLSRTALDPMLRYQSATRREPKVKPPAKPQKTRISIQGGGTGYARVVPNKSAPLPEWVGELEPTIPDLLHLGAHHCKWPIGDGPFSFCGRARAGGAPYCAVHKARATGAPPKTAKTNDLVRSLRRYTG